MARHPDFDVHLEVTDTLIDFTRSQVDVALRYGNGIYTALQNGAVDAGENSPDVFMTDRFIEVAKTFTMAKIMYMHALIVMSKSWFGSLTDAQKMAVQEAANGASKFAIAHYRADYDKGIQAMRDRDIKVIEPESASFKKVAETVRQGLVGQFPAAKPWYEKIAEAK